MAGLYLHVPSRGISHDAYVEAVTAEVHHYAARCDAPFRTLYVGGPRPSQLDLDALRRLLAPARTHLAATDLEEATIELHPADAAPAYLEGLRAMGFDRLNLDLLSFFPDDLTALGATHTADQAEAALDAARAAGFRHLSIDLFFGWKDQDPLRWNANLQKAVRLDVPHIAITECTGDRMTAASDDARAAQYCFAMNYLREQGYEHYEVAHFARPGRRSLHNQRHWNHTNYLGLGPSAHSFWWDDLPAHRWANVYNPARYAALLRQRHLPVAQRTPLDRAALAAEYVLLRLRTRDGLDLDTLDTRYGFDLRTIKADALARLIDENYIEPIRDGTLRLTDRGLLVCDAVTRQFLPD